MSEARPRIKDAYKEKSNLSKNDLIDVSLANGKLGRESLAYQRRDG